jgi:hypothetical protein
LSKYYATLRDEAARNRLIGGSSRGSRSSGQQTTIRTFTVEGEEKNAGILLANSKSLSFSTLIFGKAQERLD